MLHFGHSASEMNPGQFFSDKSSINPSSERYTICSACRSSLSVAPPNSKGQTRAKYNVGLSNAYFSGFLQASRTARSRWREQPYVKVCAQIADFRRQGFTMLSRPMEEYPGSMHEQSRRYSASNTASQRPFWRCRSYRTASIGARRYSTSITSSPTGAALVAFDGEAASRLGRSANLRRVRICPTSPRGLLAEPNRGSRSDTSFSRVNRIRSPLGQSFEFHVT